MQPLESESVGTVNTSTTSTVINAKYAGESESLETDMNLRLNDKSMRLPFVPISKYMQFMYQGGIPHIPIPPLTKSNELPGGTRAYVVFNYWRITRNNHGYERDTPLFLPAIQMLSLKNHLSLKYQRNKAISLNF